MDSASHLRLQKFLVVARVYRDASDGIVKHAIVKSREFVAAPGMLQQVEPDQ